MAENNINNTEGEGEVEEIDLSTISNPDAKRAGWNDELSDEENLKNLNITDEIIELTGEIQTKKELEKEKDKYIRLYSEFDNFKRRSALEKTVFMQTANEKIVMDILPMIDDFKRAEPLSDGIELIRKNLITTLKKYNVVAIDCIDQPFNPDIHMALTQTPNEEKKGLILEVIEEGYKMGDKVIRFPKVIIGS